MSNALAIATVTTALAQIVRSAAQSILPGSDVLTEPPDTAAAAQPRIRLFLYQVAPNAALRNNDLPLRSAEGNLVKRPAVALDLHYLLAFYGNENELEPQRMLGAVVRDLHAQAVLTRQMIADAIASQTFLTASNLVDAVEQIKFTPLALSLEDLSKLWSVFFQKPYVLSITYQGTVVLIESEESIQPAPPVLRRGEENQGVSAELGAFPTLESVHIGAPEDATQRPRPPAYPSAQLGLLVTLEGRNLSGDSVRVHFMHPHVAAKEITIPVTDRTATQINVIIPDDAAAQTEWAAGIYSVVLTVNNSTTERSTNQLPLALAPKISSIAPPNPISRDAAGNVTLTITCAPQVLPQQRAVLQLADREVAAQPHPVATATLQFVIENAPVVTDALVRLRVDGVDSLPFKREATPPPPRLIFDDQQKVTIQ
jgi:hypothetical protein